MKIAIRAFVVVLALTGAAASTHISTAQQHTAKPLTTKSSAFPIPTCPPDDPNGCGIMGNGSGVI
ncbi:hypothetical protein [Granulicella sibirica]|uniref:Uncharacterized protein n=1 Tax=Granulicella sibirica TaxID=2479048 RepID=A0A4Q0TA74_9BACT|nr:hypothetical protein [Granulicella sibirica]RXH58666.1 hypothetical protein GRAN_1976 [Granulicella sibirica]